MCLQSSVNCELINLKYEYFEWYPSDDGSKYEDYCDYIDTETCKNIEKNDHDLTIMQYNVRDLISKQRDLPVFLGGCTTTGSVDVLILVETWLTSESEKRVHVPGYEYYGVCRKSCKGGGVGFLVKDSLPFTTVLEFCPPENDSGIESCFIEFNDVDNKRLLIGSLYHPPNTCEKSFLYYTDCIMGMDHNLDLLKHHLHASTQSFLELMLDYNVLPCVT